MSSREPTHTEIVLPDLGRKLSDVYSYLGGIPARELSCALRSGDGLSVAYQPQINVRDGLVSAVEALARWHHPRVGPVPPRVFIPIAEDTGLILQITDFVLRDACALANRHCNLTVAVNLSPMLFTLPMLIERCVEIVQQCGTKPTQIEFEITERLPLAGNGFASDSIAALRALGFRIALDDYGVGYSGPRRLSRIDLDKLKIDQSFVRNLDCIGVAMVPEKLREMVELGHAMGLIVTAEGVETEEQCRFLTAVGCDALQGYFFARPMPSDELEGFLMVQDWAPIPLSSEGSSSRARI